MHKHRLFKPTLVIDSKSSLLTNFISLFFFSACVLFFVQVAPIGIADRVLLGLIPSSEESWPVACSCLRPDAGGWLHVHGNVSSKPTSLQPLDTDRSSILSTESMVFHPKGCSSDAKLSSEADDEEQSCLHLQPSPTSRKSTGHCTSAWTCWGDYVKQCISAQLAESNPVPGFSWIVMVKHIEHVKSYAPHIDHLVADLECRPRPTPSD